MATGFIDRKRICLLWLTALIWPLIPLALAPMAQAQDKPPPGAASGFPNCGLLGQNPFKTTEPHTTRSDPAPDDWSYKPRNAPKYMSQGDVHFERQEYEEAAWWYHGATLCDPRDLNALRKRGLASYHLLDYEAAFTDIDFLVRQGNPDGSDYGLRALLRCMNAKPEDQSATEAAEVDNKRCLAVNPQDARGRGVAGLIAARRGNFVRSIADLTWAIEQGADLLEFQFYLGWSYLTLERYPQAIPHFEKVSRAKHQGIAAEGHVSLASCHAAMEDPPRALADYRKAVELVPTDHELRCQRIEFAMSHGCFDMAIQDLDFVAALRPEEAGVFWCRALARLLAGKDPGLARADLDRSIAIEPRLSFFYAARAFADFKKKEYAHALGDVVRTCSTMRFCEFKLTSELDLRRRVIRVEIEWRMREQPDDNRTNNTDNLSRKLVDLGLGSLFGSGPTRPRLN